MGPSICIAHGEALSIEGGGTVRVVSLACALERNGFDVHLVAPSSNNKDREPPELDQLAFHPVNISVHGPIDQLPRAILVLQEAKSVAQEYDAILQVERATLAGVATYLGCSDYVLDLHDIGFNGPLYGNMPFSGLISKFVYHMEKRGVQHAREVIAVSERMAEFVQNEWGAADDSIHIIHNGIRSKVSSFADNDVSETPGQVSFIGSLNYNIDYDKLLKLAETIEEATIHIIGDGYKREELETAVQQRGIENVIVHGFLPDEEAYDILRRSQVCIFPLEDTHHTRVAQHMKGLDYGALGKAIATDRDGTAELLADHDAALVSDPGNPDEFIANVRTLLEDEKLRSRLGQNAKELATDLTWNNQGDQLADMYAQKFCSVDIPG